jgi:hypothetical protein
MRVRDESPELFAEEQFASAFGVRGKPGISPGQLALVTVWVPNRSSKSCDLGVFVYQPTEQVATSEVKLGWRRRWW